MSAYFSRLATWATSALAVVALTGCCKSYLIVETSGGQVTESKPAEVRSTPTFQAQLTSIKTVSIRLPDSCLQQTAAQATGASLDTQLILRSDCAIYLGELERVLVGSQLRVISWDALVRLERSNGMSTYDAAKQLGAEAVFIVNSLEAHALKVGESKGITLQYYDSDPLGNRLDERGLSQKQREVLKTLVLQRFGVKLESNETQAISATLDVTAVLAATGESMWFYRKSETVPLKDAAYTRFLFRGRDEQWRPVNPDLPEVENVVENENLSSREEISSHRSADVSDPFAKERLLLFRKVTEDFILRFRSGGA